MNQKKTDFGKRLIDWYKENHRSLPWRETTDPYKIWLSEIILQQTKVKQGLPYYLKMLSAFPTIKDFQAASEDELLNLWAGLGYYRRAIHMKKAASQIIHDFGGKFPDNYADLRKLTGVGEYTAAAIASFAFDLPYPVLDGNVSRVIARVAGIQKNILTNVGKKEISKNLLRYFSQEEHHWFNQAIMELGALVCLPKSPDCENCPVKKYCFAFKKEMTKELPIRINKVKKKPRYLHFFWIEKEGKILIEQRSNSNDIWYKLYQLPLWDSFSEREHRAFKQQIDKMASQINETQHSLTHQNLNITIWSIDFNTFETLKNNENTVHTYEWLPIKTLKNLGFPKPLSQIFM